MDTRLAIAIVEDHDDFRQTLADVLIAQGHDVIVMPDAERFEEMTAAKPIDLAIIDLNLPGEDGISLTRRLRKAIPSLGIIIVSARGLVQERIQGYESGADLYLAKPAALSELTAAVRSLAARLKLAPTKPRSSLSFASLCLTGPCGQVVKLPWHEAVLLRALILAQDRQLAYWQLIESIGKDPAVYSKSALEVLVVRLRKHMQSVGFEGPLITAVRGKGYLLLVPIELV